MKDYGIVMRSVVDVEGGNEREGRGTTGLSLYPSY